MSRIEMFRGVFGEWGWECVDERGSVIAESRLGFESLDECVRDAQRHSRIQIERRPTATLETAIRQLSRPCPPPADVKDASAQTD